MPIPVLGALATAIPGIISMFRKRDTATQLGGMAFQAGINGLQNMMQRRYERRMWQDQVSQQQRAWTMQNDYNSPVAQMERLRQAGLNPNLVYGRGADNTASSMPVSSPTISRRQPIDFNPGNSILAAQDLRIKQAQYDNLRANNTAIAQDVALKTANLAKIAQDIAKSKWDVERSKGLFASAVEAARLNNDNLSQNLMIRKGDYEMRQALGMQGLQKGIVQMLLMESQRSNNMATRGLILENIQAVKKSNVLKDWEISLSQKGLTPSDPFYLRVGAEILNYFQNNKMSDNKSWNDFNQWLKKTLGSYGPILGIY